MRNYLAIIILLFMILLCTCTKDAYSPDVCFEENVLPIFITNCTMSGCHNSKDKEEGYDLSTYEGIMKGVTPKHPLRSKVYNVINGNNPSMPPGPYPHLSSKDISFIKIWIDIGAPNSSNCGGCDTSNFSFSNRIDPIMQTWCVGCHNPGNSGGGINLADYAGVSNTVTSNRLLGSIKHLSGYSPMPQNGGQLSLCDIKAIEKWIGAGHPNN